MNNNKFVLKKLIGRFAVVKLWPEIKTAEDECIARLKIAAERLGLECFEVNADGSLLSNKNIKINNNNVDFVLHLHYDTPKQYDAFSIVALWNPINFYHEWGYVRCSRNLTSHDDFISCDSISADDHVARMIRNTGTHLPAHFNLYHSTSDVIHKPSLGDGKLFYAGINWEAISGGKSRHQEVLKMLDKTGLMRIYGPTLFQGVRVWAGYQSYVKEVPFDGFSMMDEISKAGIALVLSSQAHKESGLMSNRLFESIAAGALVICDENPFGKRFFGDSLLYIDSRSPVEKIHSDIINHIEWANKNKNEALSMIEKSQNIFREKFTLTRNLRDLYNNLEDRKRNIAEKINPPNAISPKIALHLLMPEYSEELLKKHIHSAEIQTYKAFTPILVVDHEDYQFSKFEIKKIILKSEVKIEIKEVYFHKESSRSFTQDKKRLGEVLYNLIVDSLNYDAFMAIAPNENILSNHLGILAGALQRDESVDCAASAAILLNGNNPIHGVHEIIDFGHFNKDGPTGFGRFIFRTTAIPKDMNIALPHLNERAFAVLVGNHKIDQQLPASITIDIKNSFPNWPSNIIAENEIIADYCPNAFKVITGLRYLPLQNNVQPTSERIKMSRVLLRMLSRKGFLAQVHALKRQGLTARIKAFKSRLV